MGQKYLSIPSLQPNYLNLDISSGSGKNSERVNHAQKKWTFCGGANHSEDKYFKKIRKNEEKCRAAGDSDKWRTERTPRKCFRCGSEDNIIDKFPKTPKDNKNDESKYFSVKGVIVHHKNNMRTVIMITTKRYMHLWHECLVMMKVLVEILAKVWNIPIGF